MKVRDVMTTKVLTIAPGAPLKEAATEMIRAGVSGLPVIDEDRKVIGIITEADFVTAEANRSWGRQRRRLLVGYLGEFEDAMARTVEEAMTADPHTIDANSTVTDAARTMTDLNVKRLPVVADDGTLEGIISRADVMGAFARPDGALQDEIVHSVVSDVLQLDSATVTVAVDEGAVTLSGTVPTRTQADLLVELATHVEGVIAVHSDLGWALDDTD